MGAGPPARRDRRRSRVARRVLRTRGRRLRTGGGRPAGRPHRPRGRPPRRRVVAEAVVDRHPHHDAVAAEVARWYREPTPEMGYDLVEGRYGWFHRPASTG